MRALGIGDGMKIVVYDGAGLFSAPRVWWMFRIFGARDVSILDGGFPAWKAEGAPDRGGSAKAAQAARTSPPASTIPPSPTLRDVRRALETGAAQVVDARPAERFRGEAPEPRPGLRSGHMPGALNLPSSSLTANGRLKPEAELRALIDRPASISSVRSSRAAAPASPPRSCRSGSKPRPPGEGALRRLLGGMGRAGGCAGGDRTGHGQLGNRQFAQRRDCPMPTAVSAGSGSGTASCARAAGSRRTRPACSARRSGP